MTFKNLHKTIFLILCVVLSETGYGQTVDSTLWGTNGQTISSAIYRNRLYLSGYFNHIGPNVGNGSVMNLTTSKVKVDIPKIESGIEDVIADGSGGWFIAGSFQKIGNTSVRNFAHLNSDLTYDANWNLAINSTVYKMVSDGTTLYLAGAFSSVGGQSRSGFAAIDIATRSVKSINVSVSGQVYDMALTGTTMYLGGSITAIGGETRNNIGAIDLATEAVSAWNPGANGRVQALVISGTTLFAGGTFTNIAATSRNRLASFNISTGAINTWNPSANDDVDDLAVSSTVVYVGGEFTNIGGQARTGLAGFTISSGNITTWNPSLSHVHFSTDVSRLLISGTTIYVGGDFDHVGTAKRSHLAQINLGNNNATSFVGGAAESPSCMALAGSSLFVGGVSSFGGASRIGMGSINLTTGEATSWDPDASTADDDTPTIERFAFSGNNAYVIGDFSTIGGQSRNKIAAVDVSTGNATSWNPNNSGFGANDYFSDILIKGSLVYVAGTFNAIGNQNRKGLVAINLSNGAINAWNPGASHTSTGTQVGARRIYIVKSTMYVSGNFTSIGGQNRPGIAAISLSTGTANGWNPTFVNGTPNVFSMVNDTLYLGGNFTQVNGVARERLAAVDTLTGALLAFSTTLSNVVSDMYIDGPTIYAAGAFSGGFVPINRFTGEKGVFNPSVSNSQKSIAVTRDTLVVTGSFLKFSNLYLNNVARMKIGSCPSTPTVTASGPTEFCGGSNVILTASESPGYKWSTGATTRSITVGSSGNYSVRAVVGACFSAPSEVTTVTVNSVASPAVTVSGPLTFCTGGSVTLSAPAGFTYLWSNGETTQDIVVTTAGSYTVRTVIAGCTSNASAARVVTVTAGVATPTITASGPTTICTGGSVTLSAPAGFSYLWSNGETTQDIVVTTDGSYTVRTISAGCTSDVSAATVVTVSALTTPTISPAGSVSTCHPNTITLTAPAGFSYLWSTGETTQSIVVNMSDSYTVRTISAGCTSAVSVPTQVMIYLAPPRPTITPSGPTTFCEGGSVTLTAPAGFSYLWSNNETTQSINVTTAGSYTVRTIANGCTSNASLARVVMVNTPPSTPTITANGPTTFCTGGSVTLSAPAGFSYLWSTNETTQSIVVNSAGSYTVQTIDLGCTSAVSAATVVTVNTPPTTPTITASGPTTFNTGGSVTLSAPAGFSYLWSTNETTQDIVVTTSGSYTVRTISNGCTSAVSAATVVTVNAPTSNVWTWNGTGTYGQASLWDKNSVPPGTADSIVIASGTCTVAGDLDMARIYVAPGASLVVSDNLNSPWLNVAGSVTAGTVNQVAGNTTVLGGGLVTCSTFVNTGSSSNTIRNTKVTTNKLTLGTNLSLAGVNALLTIAYTASGEVGVAYSNGAQIQQQTVNQFAVETYFDPASTLPTGGGWFNVGPPIQDYAVNNLSAGNPFAAGTYDNSVPTNSSLYLYDPTSTTWPTNQGYVKALNAAYTLAPEEGARVWLTTAKLNAGPLTFAGFPFQTDQLFQLRYCASGCSYASPNGYNLVKNPFPAILDWTSGDITRSNVDDGFWVWRSDLQVFTSFIGGIGINGGREAVAIGQAFFVRANGPGASLSLPVSATITDASFSPFRTAAIDNVLRLQVMQAGSMKDEAAIRFNALSTTGHDARYDASKMSSPGVDISTLLADGSRMGINNLPLTGLTRIPVAISRISSTAPQNLRITLEGMDSNTELFLHHPSFSSPLPIYDGFTLPLTTALSQGLEIIASPRVTSLSTTLTPTLTLRPNPATTSVQLHLTAGSFKGVSILDQLGRTVLTTTTLNGDLLDISTLAAGTYVVKVSTESGVAVQRLAVVR